MATLNFDGERPRELRFTLAAARAFKASYGKPLWRVRLTGPGEVAPEIVDPECMTHAIRACLLHEEPGLTTPEAEELLQGFLKGGGKWSDVYAAFGEACRESGMFGDDEKRAKGKGKNGAGAK